MSAATVTFAQPADAYAIVAAAMARAWMPRTPREVSEWAEQCRRLSGKSAAEPGPWSNARIPYLTAIMDALGENHPAWSVVFIKSSQVGATECALNWIGWTIEESPAPILALFPTEKLGTR
jgi:phage terminase large subunit GpA-like protein